MAIQSPVRAEAQGDPGDGLAQFVEALKSEAGLVEVPAAASAVRFGVSPAAIEAVLLELTDPHAAPHPVRAWRAGGLAQALRWAGQVGAAWKAATDSPYVFVILVLAALGMTQVLADAMLPTSAREAAGVFLMAGGSFAVLACVARSGKPLLAFFTAGLVFVLDMAKWLVGGGRPAQLASALVTSLTTASLTLLLGITAAFAGHVVIEARRTRREARLTRQELLDRQFELQARFAEGRRGRSGSQADRVAEAVRANGQYPAVALLLALALGSLRVATVSGLLGSTTGPASAQLANSLFGLLAVFFLLAVGYFAPSPRMALVSMPLSVVGIVLPTGLRRTGFGARALLNTVTSGELAWWLVFAAVGGLVVGAVLRANQAELRRRRLRTNDEATVAAEIVRTHWRLYGRQRKLVVLVIDVAGSTQMKVGADPARIEFSFRAYQELVAEIAQAHGGKVVSTAGDGAVCSFLDASSALEAARGIQGRMADFNARVNRLEAAFRVRIGLHAGESGADLAHAPFNALIDVAAHVEKVAPVGGVALSQEVALLLPNEGLVELAEWVDGHRVSVLLDPLRKAQ